MIVANRRECATRNSLAEGDRDSMPAGPSLDRQRTDVARRDASRYCEQHYRPVFGRSFGRREAGGRVSVAWWHGMMRGKRGKVLASLLAVIGVAGLWWSGKRVLGKSDAAGISQTRWMICSETGKVFEGLIQRGSVFPLYSPYSKRQTGYPAERCFW